MKLLRTEADMVEAYRARIRELNISYATVDAISGLPDGYTAKLMSPKPMKGLGEKAIEGLNGALGIGFVSAVDSAQVARVKPRWTKRKRAIDRRVASTLAAKPQIIAISAEQLEQKAQMQMWGQMGGKASGKTRRAKAMKKRARQRVASHAARMRWGKEKRV